MSDFASGGTGLSRFEISFTLKPKNGKRGGRRQEDEAGNIEPGNVPLREKDIRPITAVPHWRRQRKMWGNLIAGRTS